MDKYEASVTKKVDIIYCWDSEESYQPNECRIRIY